MPVWPRGAAAEAAAGRAATSAPDPMPATTMLRVTCSGVALKGRNMRYPTAMKVVPTMSAMRGVVRFDSTGKSSAPTIMAMR